MRDAKSQIERVQAQPDDRTYALVAAACAVLYLASQFSTVWAVYGLCAYVYATRQARFRLRQ